MPCKGTNVKGEPCKRHTAGEWCMSHQQGAGIWKDTKDAVKKVVKTVNHYRPPSGAEVAAFLGKRIAKAVQKGPRTSASTRFQAFLDKNEGNPITKIQLGRKPIVGAIHKALDTLSLGGFSRAAKKLDYDKVYHNYLLVTLADGQTHKLEKNETVIEKPVNKGDYENEIWDIPLKGQELTLKRMVDTASDGNESRFYKYRADSDNCQRFTRDMIERNGLLPDDIGPMEIQDATTMIGSLPGASLIPNAVTDAASIADRALHGDGMATGRAKVIGVIADHGGAGLRAKRAALLQALL